MAVRRLFGENDRYTQEGGDLANRVGNALHPIINECKQKGISMRDVEYIIAQEASCICLANILSSEE